MMNSFHHARDAKPHGSRWWVWVGWALRILVALVFIAAGGAKLFGVPRLVELFDQIGLGQWFRTFTAACEIGGAALLLIPRTAAYGTALLGCVAVGALVTHLVILRDNPADAIVLIVLLGAVAWLLRQGARPALTAIQAPVHASGGPNSKGE